jgi:hypothetical protein
LPPILTTGPHPQAPYLIEQAKQTIERADDKTASFDEETQSILKQIELDVNRTMPGHRLFDDGAEGGVKLRRILVAYSIHVNKAIGLYAATVVGGALRSSHSSGTFILASDQHTNQLLF